MGNLTVDWAGCCSSGLYVRMGSQEPWGIGFCALRLPFIWDFQVPVSVLRSQVEFQLETYPIFLIIFQTF